MDNDQTASGQVTVVDAMALRRPVVATRCIGTDDYVRSGENGLLVEPGSADGLAAAIESAWCDERLRQRLGANAHAFATTCCSNEAAGRSLQRVLDVAAGIRHPAVIPQGVPPRPALAA